MQVMEGTAFCFGDYINTDYIISSRRKKDTINPEELVQYLMAHPKSKNAALIAEQLYDLALLGHKTLSPEEMTRFVANAQAIMQQLIK